MQVIEKVKVVPEGYNGAGMNYDGCNRRDVNGKANAGLTLGIDKFLKPIADKDGMIDIEGIFDEEMEIINNIDNFNFDIPFIGGGNISKGIISLEVPYVNKIVALNQTDLEVLKESLISLKTK